MEKKYEITDISLNEDNPRIRRIRALRDIPNHGVKKGDLGGFVHIERNLNQDGDCWIADNAISYEFARVRDNSLLAGNARMNGVASIRDNSKADGNAMISGSTSVSDTVHISGNSNVIDSNIFDGCNISGDAIVSRSYLSGNVFISGSASVFDSTIKGMAAIHDNARVSRSTLKGEFRISGNASVEGAALGGKHIMDGDKHVYDENGYGDTLGIGLYDLEDILKNKYRQIKRDYKDE